MLSYWWGPIAGPPWHQAFPDEIHAAASTIKVPLALAVLEAIELGTLSPDTMIEIHDDFDSAVAGERFRSSEDYDQDPSTWAHLGGQLSVAQLVRQCTLVSGNLATNLLLEAVGVAAVDRVCARAGSGESVRLRRGIQDTPAGEHGLRNTVTARGLAQVMAMLAAGATAADRALEEVLRGQEHRDQIPAGLPAGLTIANKTGWIDGVSHDMAIIRGAPDRKDSVMVICLTESGSEDELAARVAAQAAQLWEWGPTS